MSTEWKEATAPQRILFLIAFLSTLVPTVLLPMSVFTNHWVVLDTPTETVQVGTSFALHSTVTTRYGLWETCTVTPSSKSCTRSYPTNIGTGTQCSIDGPSMRHRMNTTFAFLILGWLICVGISFLNLAFIFKGSSVGNEDRKKSVIIRLALTALAFLLTSIAFSVFGGTMGTWAGCGDPFCTVLKLQAKQEAEAQTVPSNITQTSSQNCGYGYSFVSGIVAFIALLITLLFIACEFVAGLETKKAEGGTDDKAAAEINEQHPLEKAPSEEEAAARVNEQAMSQQAREGRDPVQSRETDDQVAREPEYSHLEIQEGQNIVPQANARERKHERPSSPARGGRVEEPPLLGGRQGYEGSSQSPPSNPGYLPEDHRQEGSSSYPNHRQGYLPDHRQDYPNHRQGSSPRATNQNAGHDQTHDGAGRQASPSSNNRSISRRGDDYQQRAGSYNSQPQQQQQQPSPLERRDESSTRGTSGGRWGGDEGKPMPEGDDWSFDNQNNLFWSPTQKLYFDRDSGHFYDPESQLWFDPTQGRWYEL